MICSNLIKFFASILLLVLTESPLFSQDSLVWAIHGKTAHPSEVREVAIMDNGDAVFCGSYDGLITLGDTSIHGTGGRHGSRTSVFVSRVSADKEFRWVMQLATSNRGISVSDMITDAHGNIWITAYYEGIIKFIDDHEESMSTAGLLLAKVSSDGELLWGKTYSGLGARVHGYYVLPRDDGKCYILGNHGSGTFGKSKIPEGGSGQYSQYIGLVDEQGTPLWGRSIGGAGGKLTARDIIFDNEGNLLICGNYRYMNVKNIIDESNGLPKQEVEINTELTAGEVGGAVVSVSSKNGSVQAFIGRYHRDTGEPIEVHAYGNGKMSNVTTMTLDEEGNLYVGLNLYGGDLTFQGTTIPAKEGTSMVIAKLNKNWKVVWYKAFDTSSSDFCDDLSLDGEHLYSATMIAKSHLKVDDVEFKTEELWSGAIFKLNKNTGWVGWADRWEVGRANCVAMRDGVGYAGGWFHYDITIGKDQLAVEGNGGFNAVLARIGVAEPEELLALEPEPIPVINPPLTNRETRHVEAQHTIQVHGRELSIELWDNRQVDGDVISLKYNDKWILENYRLTKERKVIHLKVEPGQPNHIEMYSEDVGSIPPTTTRVSIDDGSEVQSISLRSTPETNGMIKIVFAP